VTLSIPRDLPGLQRSTGVTRSPLSGWLRNGKSKFVAIYLPETAITSTLRFIREHAAPGSKIVFDYALAGEARINNPSTRFARWGEPWMFGFPGNSAADSLGQAGLVSLMDGTMFDLAARSAHRPDGTSTLPALTEDNRARRICIAQVPGKR
jgi:O-methyltransferase involved in polyketide biosynthesis